MKNEKNNNKKCLKRVSSEEEYWAQLKKYKRKIGKLFRNALKMFKDPEGFIEDYETLLAEMEFIGLVSAEWSQSQRERLYREMNKPQEFKSWVESGLEKAKKKLPFHRKKELEKEIKKINKYHEHKNRR